MSELLNNPTFWQIVSLFAVLTIGAITIYQQFSKKSLAYIVLSEIPLLSINKAIKSKLEIYFDGTPIKDVYLVVLKIINNGRLPISSKDYEEPLSFNFGQNANILEADIVDKSPPILKPKFSYRTPPNKISFEPFLLNKKDFITIKLIIDQYDRIISEGRIVGVPDIMAAPISATISLSEKIKDSLFILRKFFIILLIIIISLFIIIFFLCSGMIIPNF